MKHLAPFVALFLCLSVAKAADAPKDDAKTILAKDDAKSIQGTWKFVSWLNQLQNREAISSQLLNHRSPLAYATP